jgi:hypothetical protein
MDNNLTFSTTQITIPEWILQQNPWFILALLIVIALSIFKLAFGSEIKSLLLWIAGTLKSKFEKADKKRRVDDWVADCRQRDGWKQKADANFIDLEGRYLKKISFEVKPVGRPENWRAGFIMGNEKFKPQDVVDTLNAITIHVGCPPIFKNGTHVWRYDKEHPANHAEEAPVLLSKECNFNLEITPNNSLKVHIGNQIVYSKRIESSFRQKLYLLAWADDANNCKVNFKNIKFAI